MKLILIGAKGRMGNEIARVCEERKVAVTGLDGNDLKDVVTLKKALAEEAVVCDFSLPQGTEELCRRILELDPEAARRVRGVVIGTTGHTPEQKNLLERVAQAFAVCSATNFSRGVFFFEELLKARTEQGVSVSELARKLGFDLSCWEAHHVRKIDAPSGTAQTLAEAAHIPADRIASSRVGAVVGEHTILFSADSEDLRITHTAHTRRLFALGAVDVCQNMFAAQPEAGRYEKSRFLIK